MMKTTAFIDAKRHGKTHPSQDIAQFVQGVMNQQIPDYQLSAWLMAVCCQGLNATETAALTQAFVASGHVLQYPAHWGPIIDKHSTGGVGDKVTLVLLPLLAACGLKIAKLSGRGLGFTGGTIDKLEAIAGFNTQLSDTAFMAQIEAIGLALSSQTPQLCPADGVFYAMRDVTATVESIALIASSVMSKKIASGAHCIVLDIKAGPGAFMKTLDEAQALATACCDIGQQLGRKVSAVISDMSQPLGYAIGNSLEVAEAVTCLDPDQTPTDDLWAVTLALGAAALAMAQNCSLAQAQQRLTTARNSGKALQHWQTWIRAQGGDPLAPLPQAAQVFTLRAPQAGYITQLDPLQLAQGVKAMGGGRETKDSALDLTVGVVLKAKLGDFLNEGQPWLEVHAPQFVTEAQIQERFGSALEVSPQRKNPVDTPVLASTGWCPENI